MLLLICSLAIAAWVFVFVLSVFEIHEETVSGVGSAAKVEEEQNSSILYRLMAPYVKALGYFIEKVYTQLKEKTS